MNELKCTALKTELAKADEPIVVLIDRFFDGNDDAASIGCNLIEHPGIDAFRETLTGLLRRSDVRAVYARIAELDPGDRSWPFTDTVIVIGSIPRDDLIKALSALQPTDIGSDRAFYDLAQSYGGRSFVVWWD